MIKFSTLPRRSVRLVRHSNPLDLNIAEHVMCVGQNLIIIVFGLGNVLERRTINGFYPSCFSMPSCVCTTLLLDHSVCIPISKLTICLNHSFGWELNM